MTGHFGPKRGGYYLRNLHDTISQTYAARLKEYQEGKNDLAFLRSLALLAKQNKDESNSVKIAEDYIRQLKGNIDASHVNFIVQYTDKSSDPGYPLLMNWVKANVKEGERGPITFTLQDIIFREQVKAYLGNNPDWGKVEEIASSNKPLDGEIIRGLSVIYYLNALSSAEPNAVKNLVDVATRYDDLYNSGSYNDWAWQIFQNTGEKYALEKAAEWSKKAVNNETDAGKKGSALDTYANILYRLGKKEEALNIQKQAMTYSPGDFEIREAYEKMQKGLPTWPEAKN